MVSSSAASASSSPPSPLPVSVAPGRQRYVFTPSPPPSPSPPFSPPGSNSLPSSSPLLLRAVRSEPMVLHYYYSALATDASVEQEQPAVRQRRPTTTSWRFDIGACLEHLLMLVCRCCCSSKPRY